MKNRGIAWPANDAGKQGGFGKCQFGNGLAKVELGGGFETIVAMPKVDLIAVHGEDLSFCVVALDLNGKKGFFDLASETFFRREEENSGELHRERAGTLGLSLGRDVANGRFNYARRSTPMLFEMLIFCDQNGFAEERRNLVIRQENATLKSKAADRLAIIPVELGDHIRMVIFERPTCGRSLE